MTKLEEYIELDKKLGQVRSKYSTPDNWLDDEEDAIIDKMDAVWREMSAQERDQARKGPAFGWPDNWPKSYRPK